MKRLIMFHVFSCLLALSLLAQTSAVKTTPDKDPTTLPVFKFEKESVDLGAIPKDKSVTIDFPFQNTGKMPLVIKNVRKNCGCTEVTFPREPIMPGKSGTISATYDASDSGVFNKKLTVLANTSEGMHVLSIRGSIQE